VQEYRCDEEPLNETDLALIFGGVCADNDVLLRHIGVLLHALSAHLPCDRVVLSCILLDDAD